MFEQQFDVCGTENFWTWFVFTYNKEDNITLAVENLSRKSVEVRNSVQHPLLRSIVAFLIELRENNAPNSFNITRRLTCLASSPIYRSVKFRI